MDLSHYDLLKDTTLENINEAQKAIFIRLNSQEAKISCDVNNGCYHLINKYLGVD